MENLAGEDDHSVDEEEVDDGDGIDQETGALSSASDIEHFTTCPTHKVCEVCTFVHLYLFLCAYQPPSAPWWMSLILWIGENAGGEDLLTALDGEIRGSLDHRISWR